MSFTKLQETKPSWVLSEDGYTYRKRPDSITTSKLDKRFLKCSRSIYVNVEQIEFYNYKENIIKFKCGETLNAVPREKRKELERHVRGLC